MIEDVFYYTHNKQGPQRNIDRHQIKFHELTFLLDGKMTYFINDERFDMVGGDIIYLPAGCMRQRDVKQGKNDYVSINFHSIEKPSLRSFYENNINEEILLLLDYLDRLHNNTTMTNPKKQVHVLEALILQISDNDLNGSKTPLAMEIVNYLYRHFRERITLDQISQETYFSAAYCESEFRKAYGRSIIHFLIDLRISEAKTLLIETSMPCALIANMVGFDDANYFSRIFKKRIGLSPLQYRSSMVIPKKT